MAKDKDAAQEQNISQVLEMLKRSYSDDGENSATDAVQQIQNDDMSYMSDEDLKKQLRMQYSAQKGEQTDSTEDSYQIDADFLTEATEGAPDEELEKEPEELEEELEEEEDTTPTE